MENYKGTAVRKPIGPKDIQGASFWCMTKRKRYHASLTWEIKDFKRCAANRDILKSTPIVAENDPEKTEWHLKCYPGGKRSEFSDYIGLYLHSETRDIDFYYGDVEFSIIDIDGQKRFCYEYKDYNIAGEKAMVGLHDYVKRSKLLEEEEVLVPNNTLTLFFKLSLCSSPESEGGPDAPETSKLLSLEHLSNDLSVLLKKEEHTFSDVTLMVEGKRFHAHRNILSARSSVFRAMFEHPLEESVNRQVEIADVSSETMSLFISALYSGRLPEYSADAADDDVFLRLLSVADKYNVPSLKEACEKNLAHAVAADNVCQILVVADLHGCEELKRKALDFVATNGKRIMKTTEWREIEKSYPSLLADAFRAIANKYIPDSTAPADAQPPRKKRKLKSAW